MTPIDCSLPGSSVHEISQARILERVPISSSRRSFYPRDWTQVFCINRWVLYCWANRDQSLPKYWMILHPGIHFSSESSEANIELSDSQAPSLGKLSFLAVMCSPVICIFNNAPGDSEIWAIFRRIWKWKCWLSSCVWHFAKPWIVAHQAPLSMEFSRQACLIGEPFSSPGDLPDTGIKPWSPVLQAEVLLSEPSGEPRSINQ